MHIRYATGRCHRQNHNRKGKRKGADIVKANFKNKVPITTNKETIEKAMKAELDRLYDKVGFDVAAQLLSVVLYSLEINYGWKRERLNAFVNNLHSTAELACGTDIFGKSIDTEQLIFHIKDRYGIDLRAEVKGL